MARVKVNRPAVEVTVTLNEREAIILTRLAGRGCGDITGLFNELEDALGDAGVATDGINVVDSYGQTFTWHAEEGRS